MFTRAPAPDPVPLTIPEELTVYGADWCGDCRRAKRHLDAAGVAYRWVDLTRDRGSKAMLTAAGLRAIPVIATPDGRVLIEPSNAELRVLVESLG
ncbi:MAG: glutathione S-transferase N-terminal domain-containing protein [Chloroflexi bacterium]|nr:glutathione S-transferase N-terminal domain-containing protein [Chloroflexota bacterium]